jgi:hypothetical protein
MMTGFSGYLKKCFLNNRHLINRMSKRLIPVKILLFFISANGFCQKTPAEQIMGIPQEYILPEINSDKGNTIGTRTGTIWEVFSVSNGNKTYSNFEGKTVRGQALFLESFFVTNKIGSFLHIFSDAKPDLQRRLLSPSAVDRGWINVNSVLLWRHCLMDTTTKRNIIAMTFSNSSVLDLDSPDQLEKSGIDAFFDPDLRENRHIKTQAKQIYYVYKTTPGSVLLGKDKGLTFGTDPKETIVGWIPADQCYLPETRVWITPNTDPAAIDEMKVKNVYPTLLIDINQAAALKTNPSPDSRQIIWKYDPDKDDKSWIFFPVTGRKDDLLKVKVVEDDFKTAYAPVKVDYMDNDLFKIVTFISNEQLFEVISNLHIINELSGQSFSRTALIEALVEMKKKKSPDMEDDQIMNLTINDFFESVFWVTNSTDPEMKMKLRKISDPGLVSEKFISSFLRKIKSGEDELKKIANLNQKANSFLSFNTRYFWIELNIFF